MMRRPLGWLVALALLAGVPRAHAGFVYFSDALVGGGTIRRMDQDGSNLQTITPTGGRPWAMAIDTQAGHLYWTSTFTTAIRRSNLDGSNVVDLVPFATGSGFDGGLALDLAGGKMYWTDREPGRRGVFRANLDGSGIEHLISTGVGAIHAIALDLARGKMYWADGPSINRANLDGSGRESVLSLTAGAYGLALDLAAGKMYWSEINVAAPRTGQLRRANLDGSGVELLLGGLNSLRGVTLDTSAGHLYFAEFNETTPVPTGFVSRINLDGSGRQNLMTQSGSLPFSIALDLNPTPTAIPEPASLTLLGIGAAGVLLCRRRRRA